MLRVALKPTDGAGLCGLQQVGLVLQRAAPPASGTRHQRAVRRHLKLIWDDFQLARHELPFMGYAR